MNSRIELLTAVACLEQDIQAGIDGRAVKGDEAPLETQSRVPSRCNPAAARLIDGAPARPAIATEGQLEPLTDQCRGRGQSSVRRQARD